MGGVLKCEMENVHLAFGGNRVGGAHMDDVPPDPRLRKPRPYSAAVRHDTNRPSTVRGRRKSIDCDNVKQVEVDPTERQATRNKLLRDVLSSAPAAREVLASGKQAGSLSGARTSRSASAQPMRNRTAVRSRRGSIAAVSGTNNLALRRASADVNRRAFPAALKAKIQQVTAQYGDRMSPMKDELRTMLDERYMVRMSEKDFAAINREKAFDGPKQKLSTIESRARERQEHITRVQGKAEELAFQAENAKIQSMGDRHEAQQLRRRQYEMESLHLTWMIQVAMFSRIKKLGSEMLDGRYLRNISFEQSVAVICMQRKWRRHTLVRLLHR